MEVIALKVIQKSIMALFVNLIIIVMLLSGCSMKAPNESKEVEIIVSAAASLKDVSNEIASIYRSVEPNIKVSFNFGSSGALQTQIEEGAPTDVFMSAAKKQMAALEEKGLIIECTKKELLINNVVLIIPKGSIKGIHSFEDLGTDKVATIALGESSIVPVGQYSEEVLSWFGVLSKVRQKANYGSDVRQILSWVESGDVDCGLVYVTDASTSEKVSVVCEAPKESHKPVIYPVAVLKSSKHIEEAKAFLEFLSTKDAVKVFEKYGFGMK